MPDYRSDCVLAQWLETLAVGANSMTSEERLNLILEDLVRSKQELDDAISGPIQDVEIVESQPRSPWLELADSICHQPFRRKL